jgi:type I restriction enzyme S subunit
VELRTVRVAELGRIVTGKTPPSTRPELFGDMHPFLTPTDIDGIGRYIEPARFLSPEGRDYQHRLLLPERSVCVVCIGATIGKVCMTARPSFTNQQINSVVVDETEHDPFFVYHLMTTLRDTLKANAGGAATPIINKSAFSEIEVRVPTLRVQQQVGAVLSAYDEMIENNTRRIQILERMAQALYREWFVHFRFPGHAKVKRVASPLGPIPQGWELTRIGDVIETLGGGTPSTKVPAYWDDGTINWYAPSDLTAANALFVAESSRKITERGLQESSAKLFPANCVMMTSRATIGVIAINTTPATTNQGFITCIPTARLCAYHIVEWIKQNLELITNVASGATFKEISRGEFRDLQIVLPPEPVEREYEAAVDPMYQDIRVLLAKNANLRRTRDLLLPKLISGALDVSKLEIETA